MAAVANAFISPQTPFSRTAIAVTADVAWNAPVNVVTLLADTDNLQGARITSLLFITRATQAANNNVAVYTKVGSVYVLINSALLGTVTPSATVANGQINLSYADDNPLYLSAGVGLAFAIGTTTTNGVVGYCSGGLY
jgi:hypothetical protein